MVKDRLVEAAVAIERSGERIRMSVRRNGILTHIVREVNDRWLFANNFTPWQTIESATVNPLLQCIRDLINQMNDTEERSQ